MGNHIAIDLGAESGRVMLGKMNNGKLHLEEIHRFLNIPIQNENSTRWDAEMLWNEIQTGLKKTFSKYDNIESIGVDTWGVDFVLLDKNGEMLDPPYHYRDTRTNGIPEKVSQKISMKDLYLETGIQIMQFNTIFQLIALKEEKPEIFNKIHKLLFMPDWIVYKLTGEIKNEYTIASTSQLMNMETGEWSKKLMNIFGIPGDIFPSIVQPGVKIGEIKPEFTRNFKCNSIPVIAVGSHDTASAVVGVPAEKNTNWAYMSSGTWSLMGIESMKALINDATNERNFTNEGGINNTIRFLKNIIGLWILQESKRYWKKEGDDLSYSQLVEMAEKAEPFFGIIDAEYKDFVNGGDIPEKIQSYLVKTGQREVKNKGQFVRIILEALAMKYSEVMKKIEDITGKNIDVLHIVGGGSKNKLLNQMTANAMGKRVIAGPVEATVCGNILTQLIAIGEITSIDNGREIIKNSFECECFLPENEDKWNTAKIKLEMLGKKYE